jgi:hypothetical protein
LAVPGPFLRGRQNQGRRNGRRVVGYESLAKKDRRHLDGDTVFEIGSMIYVEYFQTCPVLVSEEWRRGDNHMSQALETACRESKGVRKRVPFVPLMAIAAATTAFIFGLVAMLSWQECLMVVLAAAALSGGALFTVMEMRRLGKESQ